jgi:hypothetical protein
LVPPGCREGGREGGREGERYEGGGVHHEGLVLVEERKLGLGEGGREGGRKEGREGGGEGGEMHTKK